ncbi:hypothetical protein [Phytoactinopolyspora limicola]|uniref:hypothetical protein n=1 Tax=Phytoactinopolyspora limicola TaxID=2715536 RepID=UPI00140976DD|nr:hypothetical protein [Phytoactinopolyspora limicola]
MTSTNAVVHIAGPETQVGPRLRQRCAWCGALLLDYDLAHIAVPDGQDPRPSTWPVGAMVSVRDVCDGVRESWQVTADPGCGRLPDNACGAIDPEVTR